VHVITTISLLPGSAFARDSVYPDTGIEGLPPSGAGALRRAFKPHHSTCRLFTHRLPGFAGELLVPRVLVHLPDRCTLYNSDIDPYSYIRCAAVACRPFHDAFTMPAFCIVLTTTSIL